MLWEIGFTERCRNNGFPLSALLGGAANRTLERIDLGNAE